MKKFKRSLKELPKKTMALLMAFSMLLNYVLPITTVFALDSYTVTFVAQGTHTMEMDENHLKVDGQYVELRNSSNMSVGVASCNTDKTQCQISGVTEASKLNYGGNNFTLYNTNGHIKVTLDTEFTSNQVLNVEDYSEGGEQHGGGSDTSNYHGNGVSTLNYSINGAIEYTSGGGYDHGISFKINDLPYKNGIYRRYCI